MNEFQTLLIFNATFFYRMLLGLPLRQPSRRRAHFKLPGGSESSCAHQSTSGIRLHSRRTLWDSVMYLAVRNFSFCGSMPKGLTNITRYNVSNIFSLNKLRYNNLYTSISQRRRCYARCRLRPAPGCHRSAGQGPRSVRGSHAARALVELTGISPRRIRRVSTSGARGAPTLQCCVLLVLIITLHTPPDSVFRVHFHENL